MPLVFGDSFEIFNEFDISKKDVINAYSKPDRLESLSNNVRLFLKSFNRHNDRRILLLVGIQNVNNEELLAFSYWIPASYKTLRGSLLDLLEVFVNQFGFRIRIGDSEGYLLRYSERLIYGKIKNPNDLIEVLVPDQVPCQYFLFTSENLVETINKVSIYYAFAINTGKYIFWVNSYSKISLKVKSGWYDFIKTNFIDYVQPHGQTKINIHKQKTTEKLDIDQSKRFSTIEIPKIYENQFRYILQIINNLKNNEKIIFRISFDKPNLINS